MLVNIIVQRPENIKVKSAFVLSSNMDNHYKKSTLRPWYFCDGCGINLIKRENNYAKKITLH